MQGDGINYDMVGKILTRMKENGWSADNVAFGSGGMCTCVFVVCVVHVHVCCVCLSSRACVLCVYLKKRAQTHAFHLHISIRKSTTKSQS